MTTTFTKLRLSVVTVSIALLSLLFVSTTHAAIVATFSTNQTVANVTEVKAVRVLNVGAAPAASESITIGLCAVSFATTTAGVGAQDLNCGDNTATIRTATTSNDVAKTATQIAADIANLSSVSATGHGALTVAVGTTTSKVSFTTTGTEASATAINFTDGTSGDITSYISTAGVVPVAQVVEFTPANQSTGDEFNATINGSTYTRTIGLHDTLQVIVEDFQSQMDANASVSCTEDDTKVICTASSAGTSFSYSTNVVEGEGSSSHHSSGGGGGSSKSHSNTNSTSPNNGTTVATPAAPAVANASSNAAFNRDLTVGATGDDVMALQKYLNAHGYVVATTGPGSAGMETMLFGALTKAALVKLQIAAGITPTAGYFGPKTRAYIAAHP